MSLEDIDVQLTRVNDVLMDARDERIRPGLDDKSLTSWNALMISAYTDAYRCFGNDEWLMKARKSAEAIESKLLQKDGSLLHSYKDGTAKINGYLEDYCFTIEAYINLYQATFDEAYLNAANNFARYAIDHFYDSQRGMFWFTSDLDPELIARKQEVEDNVIPASNSSMAKGLFQLGTLFEIKEYKDISEKMLLNVSSSWKYGQGYSNWGRLMLWETDRYFEVAITGENANSLRAELDQTYLPDVLFMGGEKGKLPLLEGKFIGTSTIFVCENKSCQLPTESATDALSQMGR